MRLYIALVPLLLLAITGCPADTPTEPAPTAAPEIASVAPAGEFEAARFEITVDPETLAATVTPLPPRAGTSQPPQNVSYFADLSLFLKPDSFRVRAVSRDAEGDIALTFTQAHPWSAFDPAKPVGANNRADLSYTGRLAVIGSRDPQSFFPFQRSLDPLIVKDPDGFMEPSDTFVSGHENLLVPYVLLADEAKDNRLGHSNGGEPRGNFDADPHGWQRSTIGPDYASWTGYDYIHAGQEIENTLTLYKRPLQFGPLLPFSWVVALCVKYTDPRGSFDHLIPPDPSDPALFAYRLPYAAMDASVARALETVVIGTAAGSTAEVRFAVRDWDAGAVDSGDYDLSDEADVRRIQPGGSGPPVGRFRAPNVTGGQVFDLVPQGTHSGESDDPLIYTATLQHPGEITPREVFGLAEFVDPEDGDPNLTALRKGLDPTTRIPDSALALPARTYALVAISVVQSLEPPVVESVTPSGEVGEPGALVTFIASATNSPDAWSWDFGGGASPNTSTDSMPEVTLGAPGTYDGTVVASNAAGDSAPFGFQYTITLPLQPPVITSVDPTGVVGGPGDFVAFTATASNDPTAWMWDFGEGAVPQLSAEVAPSVMLANGGSYQGSVIASNAAGDSAPFMFDFSIDPGPGPLRILRVIPENISVGSPGDQMTFRAIVDGGTPDAWEWTFGPATTPSRSTLEEPSVTLDIAWDSWIGSVTVANDSGASAPYPFHFVIGAPTAAADPFAIWPYNYNQYLPGEAVQFGSWDSGVPTGWAWDFGGGATPDTSSEARPVVTMGAPGDYTGTLRLTSALGMSAVRSFSYHIGGGAPAWNYHMIRQVKAGEGGAFDDGGLSMVIHRGRPAISYWGDDIGFETGTASRGRGFSYARAVAPAPTTGGGWTCHLVESSTDLIIFGTEILVVDGRPLIVYPRGGLKVAHATTPEPTETADWNRYLIESGGNTGLLPDALLFNGVPVIAYCDFQVLGGAKIAMAGSATPTGPSDWTTSIVESVPVPAQGTGQYASLTVLNDRLALATWDTTNKDVRISLALADVPAGGSDWLTYAVESTGVVGIYPSLQVLNGRLAMTYVDELNTTFHYARAQIPFPLTSTDWLIHALPNPADRYQSGSGKLRLLNGRWVLPIYDYEGLGDQSLWVARALVEEPTSASDWTIAPMDTVHNTSAFPGYLLDAVVSSNQLEMAWFSAYAPSFGFPTQGIATIRYARSSGDW